MKLNLLAASAGTGKTYTLVEAVAQALCPQSAKGERAARPEGIMAMSYTRAAAAELRSRCAARLNAIGHADQAAALGAASFGTVHAVAGSLARRYALSIGRSTSDTIADPSVTAPLFAEVLGNTSRLDRIDPALAARLPHLLTPPAYPKRGERSIPWLVRRAKRLADLAQAYGLTAAHLRADGAASARRISSMLPKGDGPAIEARLLAAIEAAKAFVDPSKSNKDGKRWHALDRAHQGLQSGLDAGLAWTAWLALQNRADFELSQRDPENTTDRPGAFAQLRAAAAAHAHHPLFNEDAMRVTQLAFDLAADALDAYATLKCERALVDYGDLEIMALAVLECDDVRADLAEQLDLLVVDEFQDTSPVQMAIFAKLLPLARRTIWAGDPKQTIYGFRGASSGLVERARQTLQAHSDKRAEDFTVSVLQVSRRSTPRMLGWLNSLFVPAFTQRSMAAKEVELKPPSSALPEASPRIATFLQAKAKAKEDAPKGEPKDEDRKSVPNSRAIAAGLADKILSLVGEAGPRIRATDPSRKAKASPSRPARAGDIAVLCRTNNQCREVAAALAHRNMAARVDLPGLLATPEGQAVQAALGLALRPACKQAQAQLVRWCGRGPVDVAFVERLLGRDGAPLSDSPAVAAVAAADLAAHSPATAVDRAIACLGLHHRVDAASDWASQQLTANLGALRALAACYETDCAAQARPAHLSGFLYHLADLAAAEQDFLGQVDQPAGGTSSDTPAEQAVAVRTLHDAKGLEWPIVFLVPGESSETRRKGALLEPHVVPQERPLDLDNPLADSHLRMFGVPFDAWRDNSEAFKAIENAPEGRARLNTLVEEDLRLLYVGMTRAKDQLFLVTPYTHEGPASTLFDCLPALIAQRGAEDRSLAQAGADLDKPITAELLPCSVERGADNQPAKADAALALKPLLPPSKPGKQTGSQPQSIPKEAETTEIVIGPALWSAALHKPHASPIALGNLMHAFFPAALRLGPGPARATLAQQISTRWGLAEVLTPATLEAATDALAGFIARTYPGGRLRFELPYRSPSDAHTPAAGAIDMLVEHDAGVAIIDHKLVLAAPQIDFTDRLAAWAGQLGRYRDAAHALGGASAAEVFIHLPLQGRLARLDLPDTRPAKRATTGRGCSSTKNSR